MGCGFVDYYEVMQVSQRAESATISRVFRHLAKRYHPDNQETGNRELFDQLAEAWPTRPRMTIGSACSTRPSTPGI